MTDGVKSLVSGLWSLVCGLWSLVYGLWSLVYGFWFVVSGFSLFNQKPETINQKHGSLFSPSLYLSKIERSTKVSHYRENSLNREDAKDAKIFRQDQQDGQD